MTSGATPRALRDLLAATSVALPPLAVAAWSQGHPGVPWWPIAASGAASLLLAVVVRGFVARRLGTVASVLASFRDGDLSVRARVREGAVFDHLLAEVNALGDTLRDHRLGELEAWALLRKVMAEIDVVVLAFDDEGRVRLANNAAARALDAGGRSLAGRSAAELGLADLLEGEAPRAVRESPALSAGPWELRRGGFRLSGRLHTLVVLADVSGALRDQEREAWKRLIRVMSHEINNSLAPIQSIAQGMLRSQAVGPRAADWEQDLSSGLTVIARRAEALGRFLAGYTQLARLPRPQRRAVGVEEWVLRVVALETRMRVASDGGPAVEVLGDPDQLDPMLINLVKNAADATLEVGGGGVRVRWTASDRTVEITVEDDGPGVPDTANLFVPFFTTKPGGSGIGLVVAQQIAEAHGGRLSLRRRDRAPGTEAVVRLPRAP